MVNDLRASEFEMMGGSDTARLNICQLDPVSASSFEQKCTFKKQDWIVYHLQA